jgi:hypothetical protein
MYCNACTRLGYHEMAETSVGSYSSGSVVERKERQDALLSKRKSEQECSYLLECLKAYASVLKTHSLGSWSVLRFKTRNLSCADALYSIFDSAIREGSVFRNVEQTLEHTTFSVREVLRKVSTDEMEDCLQDIFPGTRSPRPNATL